MGVQCPERIAEQAKKFAASSDLSVECRGSCSNSLYFHCPARGELGRMGLVGLVFIHSVYEERDLGTVLESKDKEEDTGNL